MEVILLICNQHPKKLNEVVVIGYGTSKAKDLTAPIAIVKAEDLVKRTTSSPMNALQGSAAGVQVVTGRISGLFTNRTYSWCGFFEQ